MNPLDAKAEREEKAVAALISAAVHQDETPVPPALVAKYLLGGFTLSEEDARALARAKLTLGSVASTENTGSRVAESNVAALHRQKPQSGLSRCAFRSDKTSGLRPAWTADQISLATCWVRPVSSTSACQISWIADFAPLSVGR